MATLSQRECAHQITEPASWAELPLRLRQLLVAEGFDSPSLWIAAGRRRRSIFGVTSKTVAMLDAIARRSTRS
jgi:hypothetical protein